jgi:carboxymethylenebutenolidase
VPDTHIDAPGGPVRAYIAEPTTHAPHPGVVVIHELLGVTDDMRAKADRFAARGYLALVPDLFSNGNRAACVLGAFRALNRRSGAPFEMIEAARATLAERPDCTGRVGVIGFCMGGGFALLSAPAGRFAAASVNYGPVPRDARELLAGSCPVVGSYGGRDRFMRGAADRLEQALEAQRVSHDVKEYPGASHSFLSQYTGVTDVLARITGMGHHSPSADDAWRRIDAFFDEHVAGR